MDVLVALLGFAFVSSVTPGPNNVLLWASGAAFGFRRSIRHILGTAVGIGAMALTVGVGLGVLLATLPQVALAMRVGASGYLLVLAYRIAAANTIERPAIAKPLDLRQAAAFQALNPKAWIFALGAVTAFRPDTLPVIAGTTFVAVIMMLVVVPTAALWAAAGSILARFVSGRRSARVVNLSLAGLVVAAVAAVWL